MNIFQQWSLNCVMKNKQIDSLRRFQNNASRHRRKRIIWYHCIDSYTSLICCNRKIWPHANFSCRQWTIWERNFVRFCLHGYRLDRYNWRSCFCSNKNRLSAQKSPKHQPKLKTDLHPSLQSPNTLAYWDLCLHSLNTAYELKCNYRLK